MFHKYLSPKNVAAFFFLFSQDNNKHCVIFIVTTVLKQFNLQLELQ